MSSINYLSHGCDSGGFLSAEIELKHSSSELFGGATCAQGLEVKLIRNGGSPTSLQTTETSAVENPAGQWTRKYTVGEQIDCGDTYTLISKFHYHTAHTSDESKVENQTCECGGAGE